MDIRDIIARLSASAGPSGSETGAVSAAAELLAPCVDEIHTDTMGSLIAVKRCGKPGAPKVMLDAHLDEIGFVVTGFEEGFARFACIGGIDPRMLPACEVRVLTDPPIRGVIAIMPVHVLSEADREKPVRADQMYIDLGLTQEEAEALVPVGTPVVYSREPHALGSLLCGKALDDRSCFGCLIRTAELLKDAELNVDVYIVGTVQEEVGLRGAGPAAYAIRPDYAIAVDVCDAETPGSKGWQSRKLGGGPVIEIGPNMNRRFSDRIRRAAEQAGITCQTGVCPGGSSGTDTSVIQTSREGVCTALISLPLRYMHTPSEVIDPGDAEALARLLAAVLTGMEAEA